MDRVSKNLSVAFGFSFDPYFNELNYQKQSLKAAKKELFLGFRYFTAGSIVCLSTSKERLFEKNCLSQCSEF
jgi:hypothetical protein